MTADRSSLRLVGIDIARCLALVGMMAAHLLRGVEDGRVTLTHQVVSGRSSALFAVLAGLAIVLLAGTREPVRGRAWRGEQAAAWARALGLGVLGLLLGLLDSGVAVILTYYAVLFVLATPFLALPTRWVAASAAGVAVLGAPLSLGLRSGLSSDLPEGDPEPGWLLSPLDLVQDLLLSGSYPSATWLPYVLVGMVLGRLDLRSPVVARQLAAAGAAAVLVAWAVSDTLVGLPAVRSALAASAEAAGLRRDLDTVLARGLVGVTPTDTWTWLLVRAPHSGAWFDLLTTIGSACLVVGLCLLLGSLVPSRWLLLAGAGTMTLSLYSLHVVLRADGLWDGTGWGHLVGQVGLVLALGALAAHRRRRGPLEVLMTRLSRAARRRVLVGGPEPQGPQPRRPGPGPSYSGRTDPEPAATSVEDRR